jgi:RNA polymerase-binding transcription factor DksA
MKTTPVEAPSHWSWHRRALLALRAALQGERDDRDQALRTPWEEGGQDTGDVAMAAQERDELLAELGAEDTELAEIDAALERIRAGTYGVCADTGAPISPERLRAVPWTRYSQAAALRRERHG